MRNKQIEKVSQGLSIVTSVLAVCLLLLGVVIYSDLPAHMSIHVNFWGEGNSLGPRSGTFMWPAALSDLSIYQRSYQSAQPYDRWLKVLLIIVNLDVLFSILRPFIRSLI